MEQNDTIDEKSQLNEVLKILKNTFKFLHAIEGIKINDTELLEKIEKFLKEVPAPEILAQAIKENVEIVKKTVESIKTYRTQSFKKIEAEYIRSLKAENKAFREITGGWRVGCLKLKTRPELSKLKILYNDELLINLTSIRIKEDFYILEEKAMNMLNAEKIPTQELIDSFWVAYQQAIYKSTNSDSRLVPIKDFYKEVRIALIRGYLDSKNPTSKIDKFLDFPIWAFLYNLDTYRALGKAIPESKRLALQTGSLQETSQGKGLIVNGLNANEDYKMMCYITTLKGGDGRWCQ